jgi:hypothetical protein
MDAAKTLMGGSRRGRAGVAAAVGVLVSASVVAATLALGSSTATAGRPERDAAVCEPPRVAPVQSPIARDAAVDRRSASLRQRRRKSAPGVRACAPLPGAPSAGAGELSVDPSLVFASVFCQGPRSGESVGPVIATTVFVTVRAGEAWTCAWINSLAHT